MSRSPLSRLASTGRWPNPQASSRIDRPPRGYPSAAQSLAYLRRHPCDVLHTSLFQADVLGRVAGRLAGTPVIVSTLHYAYRLFPPWLRWAIRLDGWTSRLGDRVIAVSESVRDFAVQVAGMPAQDHSPFMSGSMSLRR